MQVIPEKENVTESGRSMVEMLGVLAVIGLLSVMGIAGFKSAMNKNKANALLNEAQKRAVVVAGQIGFNMGSPSILEFNNASADYGQFESTIYGTKGTSQWKNTGANPDQRFTLSVIGVEKSICELVKTMTETNGVVKNFKPETCIDGNNNIKLTYNNDLSAGDGIILEEYIDSSCRNVICSEGEECVGGICIAVEPNVSDGCVKNSDCKEWCKNQENAVACYCNISAHTTWNTNNCYDNFIGTCATINETEENQGYSFRGPFTWWGSANFCKALRKDLPTKGTACNQENSGCYRISGQLELYWLRECFGEGCSDNSCKALYGNYGSVNSRHRYSGLASVWCR